LFKQCVNCHGVALAEGRGDQSIGENRVYYIQKQAGRQEHGRHTGLQQTTIDIDRQRLNGTEGTKYMEESNITRCKQVKQMTQMRE